MKILLISQNYYPEQFRITDTAEELVFRGHEVTVLTGLPNYPIGKIFKGYKGKEHRNEVINGVRVIRCSTVGRRKGILFRFLNYYSFAFSSKRFVKKLGGDFDVVLVNQLSPVMMANAGIKYKKLFGKKLVLYCLDLWPESLVAGGIKRNSFIYKHYHKVSEKIYKSADKILVTSESFKKYFADEFGIKDTVYLPQYAESIFNPKDCEKIPDGKIDLTFAGNIGKAQKVDTIISAAKILRDEKDLYFHIVGDGSELENVKKSAEGLTNVFFYGKRPLSEMPSFYKKSDAMLLTMESDPVLSYTLPGKYQSYIAAGKPVIGAIDGEAKRVIEKSGAGYCANAEDEKGLAVAVKKFIAEKNKKALSENAVKFFEENFAKEKFFTLLESILEEYKTANNKVE